MNPFATTIATIAIIALSAFFVAAEFADFIQEQQAAIRRAQQA